MANIAITTLCNRDCDHCFAGSLVTHSRSATTHMSVEDFDRALDCIERSGIRQARLLGGEPTLHPSFAPFADRVLSRGLGLVVFSNGFIPEPALSALEGMPQASVAVLVNMPAPGEVTVAESGRLERNLTRLGRKAYAGFSMVSAGVSLDFLLDVIARCGLNLSIRLGLAHTTLEGANAWLHPRFYPAAGLKIANFAEKALSQGVRIEFDCGFVPCMFPEGFLEWLRETRRQPALGCTPILDILPNLEVVSCYPLLNWRRELLPHSQSTEWLRNRFDSYFREVRPLGIYRTCTNCDFRRRGECTGGCLAASMQRLRPARVRSAAVPEEHAVNATNGSECHGASSSQHTKLVPITWTPQPDHERRHRR